MTAGYVVLFAYSEDGVDCLGYDRMFIFPWMTKFLAQVALAYKHDAYPRYLFQNLRQVIDGFDIFTLNDRKYFALRGQRPNVSPSVILLLGQSPVPSG